MSSRGTSLTAVRATLQASSSSHAALFLSLVDSGKLYTMRTQVTAVLKMFGPDQDDLPRLGKQLSPFGPEALPSVQELRDILLRDLEQVEDDSGGWPVYLPIATGEKQEQEQGQEGEQSGRKAAMELITNITHPTYTSPTTIAHLSSPTLDDLCASNKEEPPDILFETPLTCNIHPCNTLLSLQHHNESTSFSTLMTGTIIYIIWPPTPHNLTTLQRGYEAFATDLEPEKLNAVSQALEGGITFIQNAGDALRIPPFCPLMALTTSTTVLATYSLVTASSFLAICQKLPFLSSWWATEVYGEQKRADFGAALLDCVSRILEGEFEDFEIQALRYPLTSPGPLLSVLEAWDGIKDDLVGVLDEETKDAMAARWKSFLGNTAGKKCYICGKMMRIKKRDIGRHFEKTHWM